MGQSGHRLFRIWKLLFTGTGRKPSFTGRIRTRLPDLILGRNSFLPQVEESTSIQKATPRKGS